MQLGLDRVTDGSGGRRLRRPSNGGFEGFDFLALDLLLRRAITQADFVLFRFEAQNLEIVFAAGGEDRGNASTARSLLLRRGFIAVAFGTALLDFRNVAEAFDAFGQFDERAEVGGTGDFSFDDFADFVVGEPIGPDVFELFDKYNLRMLTVIDEEKRPIGTVTVDDVVSRLVNA